MTIDVDLILGETIRFEVKNQIGEVLRWGECCRRDLFVQAREGETVRELAASIDSI